MRRALLAVLLTVQAGNGWGVRGHHSINRAAVRALPEDGPVFLRAHEEWIVYLSTIPDTWRYPSEPGLKILEDPNHGWFKEQFSMLKEIPRSRYEFVLALDYARKQQQQRDPEAAKRTNVRWTGTLPYAAQENYDRMKTAMRRYRKMKAASQQTKFVELEIASYMGRLGHYTGDGAQPLHNTIHHDGWAGENPRGYTREPRVHGRFESQFVDLIEAKSEDFQRQLAKPVRLNDAFATILAHLDKAFSHVEEVYQLEKAGAFTDKDNEAARKLTFERMASGAEMLRDLAYTAWLESAEPFRFNQEDNPIDPRHSAYNPATGSAPPGPPAPNK